MYIFAQGGTNVSIDIPLEDSSGAVVTGIAHNDAGASCYYRRPGSAPVQITLGSLADETAAHSDGGFVEVDGTNQPGLYRLDLPDAAVARGENHVVVTISFNSTRVHHFLVMLNAHPPAPQGEVDDASATATSFVTTLPGGADDVYNDAFLLNVTAGWVRLITDWDDSTKTITIEAAPSAPSDEDDLIVIRV